MTFTEISQGGVAHAAETSTSIAVCITCRRPSDPEEGTRPGALLAAATIEAARDASIPVRRVRCLANCKRSCSAAIIRDGGWAYVFGDLDPATAGPVLVVGAQLFARASDGLMPWRGRPEPLKRGMIARVPPIGYEDSE